MPTLVYNVFHAVFKTNSQHEVKRAQLVHFVQIDIFFIIPPKVLKDSGLSF